MEKIRRLIVTVLVLALLAGCVHAPDDGSASTNETTPVNETDEANQEDGNTSEDVLEVCKNPDKEVAVELRDRALDYNRNSSSEIVFTTTIRREHGNESEVHKITSGEVSGSAHVGTYIHTLSGEVLERTEYIVGGLYDNDLEIGYRHPDEENYEEVKVKNVTRADIGKTFDVEVGNETGWTYEDLTDELFELARSDVDSVVSIGCQRETNIIGYTLELEPDDGTVSDYLNDSFLSVTGRNPVEVSLDEIENTTVRLEAFPRIYQDAEDMVRTPDNPITWGGKIILPSQIQMEISADSENLNASSWILGF